MKCRLLKSKQISNNTAVCSLERLRYLKALLYLFMTSNQLSACSINSANFSISGSLLNNSLMASTTDFDNNSIHNLTFCLKLRYIATSQLALISTET